MKSLALALICAASMLLQPAIIHAQDASSAAEAAVLQKQSLAAEILQLETIYRGQLTEYRAAEKEFQIAQDQYEKLQTLASINAVTESAKKVMRLRTQVLLTYFELLRVHLVAAEGVDVTVKQTVINHLAESTVWLQTHQTTLGGVTDREELNILADAFTEQEEPFINVSQEAGSLLSIGKLQNVFDRLNSINEDLAVQEASNTAITQNRALRETVRLRDATRTNLTTIWTTLTQDIQRGNVSNFYDSLARTLNPVYSDLNKFASFLDELLRSL